MLTFNQVHTLKGAPISVLCLLLVARQPVTQEFCCRHSGYSDKTVRQALRLLEEMGFISHSDRCAWQIMPGLPMPFVIPGELPATAPSRKNSDSALAPSSSSSIVGKKKRRSAAEEESEKFRLNLAALTAAGIMGKTAKDLAAMAHITPAYIRAHAAAYAKAGYTGKGLLVCRLRDGDPAPESQDRSGRSYITGELAAYIQH